PRGAVPPSPGLRRGRPGRGHGTPGARRRRRQGRPLRHAPLGARGGGMRPVAVVAASAVSALGGSLHHLSAAVRSPEPPSGLRLVPEAGLGLRHPLVGCAALANDAAIPDRATRLLCSAAHALADELERVWPDFREQRVAILVGTSSGAMPSMLAAFAARDAGTPLDPRAPATYFAPVSALASALSLPHAPRHQLLGACASSTLAIGLGARWVDAGHADLVIAGGYDALNPLVALGFEAVGALTRAAPQPFRAVRDGMALGEGAGLVALAAPRTGLAA